MSRSKLYAIILTACSAGYVWLYYSLAGKAAGSKGMEVCLVKHATGVPCPSCGATRAVLSITEGDFLAAFHFNPIGYLVAGIMLIAPTWIIIDLLTKQRTFLNTYQRMELHIKRPLYAATLIFLVVINWIWTITKGL